MDDKIYDLMGQLEEAKSDYRVERFKREEFESAIQRVRELHKPVNQFCVECSAGERLNETDEVFVAIPYPCPTIKALEGEQ